MTDRVSELFAGEPAPPPAEPGPALGRVRRLLWSAVALDLVGPFTCTGLPGAIVTLWAWSVADGLGRSAGEAWPKEDQERLDRYQAVARWLMAFSIVSLLVQTVMVRGGCYDGLWERALAPLRANPAGP